MKTLDRLIEQTGATALVAPHFYGASALGRYKEQHPDAFTAVVLTDYVPHPLGVPDNLDLYIVADDAAAETVEKIGVPADRIHPTGIPIDPAFELPADVPGVRKDVLEFPEDDEDDLPVVIVMGGGLGGGHLENVVTSLLEASAAMHLVVLCGSNTRDRERLQAIAQARGRSATFLSFTDRVRDLMAASHVLVTKPGGMSCTESLASGLPQVLFNPIPGQEEDNAAAMVRYGAGVMVDRTEDILGADDEDPYLREPPPPDAGLGAGRPSSQLGTHRAPNSCWSACREASARKGLAGGRGPGCRRRGARGGPHRPGPSGTLRRHAR